MDDYISRAEALSALGDIHPMDYNAAASHRRIKLIPAADVAQVVHGAWVPSDYPGFLACSVCHDCYVNPEWPLETKWHWCPECGARMDGRADNG